MYQIEIVPSKLWRICVELIWVKSEKAELLAKLAITEGIYIILLCMTDYSKERKTKIYEK